MEPDESRILSDRIRIAGAAFSPSRRRSVARYAGFDATIRAPIIRTSDGGLVPVRRSDSNAAYYAGEGVKLTGGGLQGAIDTAPAWRPAPVVPVVVEAEKLHIALFFGNGGSSYYGGDRTPATTTPAFPPEASGTDYRIDKASSTNKTIELTTDAIPSANAGSAVTITTKLAADPENRFSDSPFKRPREAIGNRFAREVLWYDVDPTNAATDPTFPTDLHAVYQGTVLTTPVTSSTAMVFNPSTGTNSIRETRVQADTWITPTYKKPAFIGSNWRFDVADETCFFYLEYRPILLSKDGQNCLFRREQFLAGYPVGSFPPYVTALQGYSAWTSAVGGFDPQRTQFWVDYWLLWEGVEYRITNPAVLGQSFDTFINYGAVPVFDIGDVYFDDFNAVFGGRFKTLADAIYFVNLPTTLLFGGVLIVNSAALAATNQIPVRKYTFTLDSGAGTATFTDEGPTNYKMLFYPAFASLSTTIGAASFAP